MKDGGEEARERAADAIQASRSRLVAYLAARSGDVASAEDALAEAVLRGEIDPDDKKACGSFAPRAGKQLRMTLASDYLRTQAIARLMLDNIPGLGSSWVTMGPHIGQMALFFGANDMGSVMMEENVVSSAGTAWCLDETVLCRLIRDAGFTPAVPASASGRPRASAVLRLMRRSRRFLPTPRTNICCAGRTLPVRRTVCRIG